MIICLSNIFKKTLHIINFSNSKDMNSLFRSFFIFLFFGLFFGCNGQKSETIKIGAILPMSGKMANYGKSSQAALQAMLKVINVERSQKGYPLMELVVEDDKMEVKGGVSAINKLIQKDKVPAVIGPDASSIALGVAPIAEANKTVVISPASTSTDITKAGDYIFRTILSGEYEGKIAASLYNKLYAPKKLVIMYINNEYGISLKNSFVKNIDKSIPLKEISYDEKEINFSSYLTKIKLAGDDVIYLIGYNEMVQIYQQAKELDLQVKWLGTAQMGTQTLIKQIGSSADGTIFPFWELNVDQIKKTNSQFYSEFAKLSGGMELDAFAANSVDALLILNDIIKDNSKISGEEIKQKLYNIKNFNGITGSISFDANGDVDKMTVVKIVQSGTIVTYR